MQAESHFPNTPKSTVPRVCNQSWERTTAPKVGGKIKLDPITGLQMDVRWLHLSEVSKGKESCELYGDCAPENHGVFTRTRTILTHVHEAPSAAVNTLHEASHFIFTMTTQHYQYSHLVMGSSDQKHKALLVTHFT